MGAIRCTFILQQWGQSTSESLWLAKTSADLSTYQAIADRLMKKRILTCGKETYATGIRISEEGVFRDGYTFHYPVQFNQPGGTVVVSDGGVPLSGNSRRHSDAVDTSLIVRMRNNDFTRWKNLFMRCIWDDVVDFGGRYIPFTQWLTAYNQWAAQLVTDQWGWLGVGTRMVANVTACVQGTFNKPELTFDTAVFPAGPWPNNAQIRLSKVNGSFQVNGPRLVTITAQNACKLVHPVLIGTYAGGGKVSYSPRNTFIAIADATMITGVGERKAGRIPFVPRGRQLVRNAV